MAKLQPERRAICRVCNTYATVTVEVTEAVNDRDGVGSLYTPASQTLTINCACNHKPRTEWFNKPKEKETKLAKQYETTETKSLALNTIVSKVEAVERALYNRVEARAKLESMHAQHIADASTALDRVMAEAFQKGITEEDLENHLPDYQDELTERLISVANDMSLANVLEAV